MRWLERSLLRAGLTGAVALSAVACNHDTTEAPVAAHIAIVSGNGQEVRDGSRLSDPLTVRIVGAGGHGVSGVEVVWRVTQGSGVFHSFPDDRPVSSAVSVSDADGVARVYFVPTAIGQSVVTAAAEAVTSSSATFIANDRPRFEILFGPLFDCTPFSDPSRFSLNNSPDMVAEINVTISVGYYRGLAAGCTARVKTTSVPAGGEAFDSGILHPGETFAFTPRAAGTWEFTDVINGGSGLLIVR